MYCSQQAGAAPRRWGGNRVEHPEQKPLGAGPIAPLAPQQGYLAFQSQRWEQCATCMALHYTVVDTANWAQGSWDLGGWASVVILIVLPDLLIRWSCPSSSL